MRTPRSLCGVGTVAIAGEEQACDIATSRGFSATNAPYGVVAESAESNLAGNLAFGRVDLLTRVDGLEVPHYFSVYVICGGNFLRGSDSLSGKGGPVAKLSKCG